MAMTEQIRRAAVRAGIMGINGTSVATHKLEAFADYLLDEENEACALVCEERYSNNPDLSIASGEAGMCAYHIRARRKQ
jgi:hypothetical protein